MVNEATLPASARVKSSVSEHFLMEKGLVSKGFPMVSAHSNAG